jgi:hypothetical protein
MVTHILDLPVPRRYRGAGDCNTPILSGPYPVVTGDINPAYVLGDRERDQQWYSLKVLSSEF